MRGRRCKLRGVVASVEVMKPHSYIYLEVRVADGGVERWALKGAGAAERRRGLQNVVKSGDAPASAAMRPDPT